jgi:hypothetical protein
MAVDEIVGEALSFVGEVAVRFTMEQVFSGHTARFFHGFGRRIIALTTLGQIRIPTSLRESPKGTRPKPRRSDWIALWVGVLVWASLAVGVAALLFPLF